MATDVQKVAQRYVEDADFRRRIDAAASDEERLEIAKAEGFNPDPEEARTFREQSQRAAELSEGELGEVVGGSDTVTTVTTVTTITASASAAAI